MSEFHTPTTASGEWAELTPEEIDQYGDFNLVDESLRVQTERDQQALDEELTSLQPEILAGEVILNNTDAEGIGAMDREITRSLNEKFSFRGLKLSVVGRWHKLDLFADPEGDGYRVEMVPEEVCETAVCEGFAAAIIDGEWRIGPSFSAEPQKVANSIGVIVARGKAIVLPEEATLITTPQEIPAVAESHADRALTSLENHNSYLMLHLDKSEFLRASHSKQQRFIDTLAKDVHDDVMPPNGEYMDIEVEASTVYVPDSTSPDGFRRIARTEEEPCDIAGTLLGVGILEQSRLDQRQLRDDADFIDRGAGLCLIVQPYDDNLTAEQIEGRHLYVPFNYCTGDLALLPYTGSSED